MNMLTTFKLRSLTLREVSGYAPQVQRDMMYHINDTNQFQHVYDSQTLGGTNHSLTTLSQVIPDMLNFRTEGTSVNVAQGWSQNRFVWFMDIEVHRPNGVYNILLSGYTDHSDRSHNGRINPQMRMYVTNSVEYVPITGALRISKSCEFILPDDPTSMTPSHTYTARPYDVLNSNWMATDEDHLQAQRKFQTGEVGRLNEACPSFASNSSPLQWTQRTMNALSQATNMVGVDQFGYGSNGQVFQEASGTLREDSLSTSSIFQFITPLREDMLKRGNNFEFAALNAAVTGQGGLELDHPSNQLANIMFHRGPFSQENFESANWMGNDQATMAATTVRAILPQIMQDAFMMQMALQIDNMPRHGSDPMHYDPSPYNVRVVPAPPIMQFSSNVTDQFTHASVDNIINRVKLEICPLLTANNARQVSVFVSVNLAGSIALDVSVDGIRTEHYVSPSFASNKVSPIIVNGLDSIENIRDGVAVVNSLMNEVRYEKTNGVAAGMPQNNSNNLFN